MNDETKTIRPCVGCRYHEISPIGYNECTRNAHVKINRVSGETYMVGNTMCEIERAPWWTRWGIMSEPIFIACGPRGKFFEHNAEHTDR